ncbi:metallopeptidase family protein [Sphingomonas sp. LY160]|uniref:metallopeptidase family protein n=1 Tax=Sphingomonas sp. LY160 TaxID=3095342 RepID=UPI002ADEAA06|nr:metallopeptidase family protein [Sphingomonas sp. LY160]MEA1072192.1 metallopeptidase family protein [Sphingomonas sp. LY160]
MDRPLGGRGASGKLGARARSSYAVRTMLRRFDLAPSAAEIEAIARAALDALPEPFAGHLAHVVLQVDEMAEEELLSELEIDHPLDLTGVYEGIPIHERGVETSGTLPDRIRLFRRAILEEWIEDGEELEHLVRHILIHEAGHHFGFSDEDMHALEGAT